MSFILLRSDCFFPLFCFFSFPPLIQLFIYFCCCFFFPPLVFCLLSFLCCFRTTAIKKLVLLITQPLNWVFFLFNLPSRLSISSHTTAQQKKKKCRTLKKVKKKKETATANSQMKKKKLHFLCSMRNRKIESFFSFVCVCVCFLLLC